jgi:TRAP-type C4-dicarboxylate transport system permease small subunit
MRDVIYVLCAVIGLLLTAVGIAQYQESMRAKSQSNGFPATIERIFSQESRYPPTHGSSSAGMVPAETVLYLLFGYVLQMVGCAVYAENRGRSAVFGLLGLLSPIGYVFLALLTPTRPQPSRDCQMPMDESVT